MTSKHQRAQAEAEFKKRVREATKDEKAKAERDARAEAVDANTRRLRALRLEKERADREAAAKPATKKSAS